MTVASYPMGRAPRPSGLADVLDVVLDKGIVIDAYVRVALVGIEILTIDARIVIASVDTYLRFAEAVNRLDIQPKEQVAGLPGLMREVTESSSRHRVKGALGGIRETAEDVAEALRGSSSSDQNGRGMPAERFAPAERRGGREG
ncbi:gas vesicle structural protein GvpA [Frankia sp. Mgl5]|uniref:gas vesicle structural protein GvpA n=1 Tax=Frankiaceae TaxID=74712 RepID=UPI000DA43E0D|nr:MULTISPECIES: gas vesicle structural protein GvpA [Frankiaceae]MCK9931165.1 gas vesicle structural protein GvpA [Frankia sp. Mgl5]TCJ31997.1 gas vesicle structural protein GvpA [Parafrankia sp. BMG5.11]CAI7976625.1 Gas vesicle structural protein 1 [Frankia sp. Hr75.2]SQD96863.1 putative gas vesicle structural protein 1 [Parafrankia sp. Ea1.12]